MADRHKIKAALDRAEFTKERLQCCKEDAVVKDTISNLNYIIKKLKEWLR